MEKDVTQAHEADAEIVALAPADSRASTGMSLMPTLLASPEEIQRNMAVFQDFVRGQLKEGEDYMVFEERAGAKYNLLKPGAEKMLTYHGFGIEFELDKDSCEQDFNPLRPVLRFVYRARVYDKRTGATVVSGIDGEANSYEDRYYFTNKPEWELTPIEKEAAKNGAYQVSERPNRKDPTRKYRFYKIPNPPNVIFAHANTLRKMALKRALVPATIMACRASGVFTQDMEDMPATRASQAHVPSGTHGSNDLRIVTDLSLDMIATIRGQAQALGLNLETLNAVCRDVSGKEWMTYDAAGGRVYPCTQEEATRLAKRLGEELAKGPSRAAPPVTEEPARGNQATLDDLFGAGEDE